jgi:hypothetical protein
VTTVWTVIAAIYVIALAWAAEEWYIAKREDAFDRHWQDAADLTADDFTLWEAGR